MALCAYKENRRIGIATPLAYVTVSAETEAIRRGARVRFQPVRDSLAFVVLSALFSSCALALWNAFATQAFNNLALRPGMKRLLAVRFSSGINRVSIVSSFYRSHTAGARSQRASCG